MEKIITKVAMIVAIAAVAGYGVYVNQQGETPLSDTMLENVEALADAELPSEPRCNASWSEECCICGSKHYTYAYPNGEQNGCNHGYGCSHYY